MKTRKTMALLMAPLLGALSLAACTPSGPEVTNASIDQDWSAADPITIDVFSVTANYMGIQGGWFGKVIKDKFNMELNIIAPNVAGGGDTLYNTRVAGGELGDLIIVGKGQQLDELVEGGLMIDASPYYENMTNTSQYDPAVEKLNEGKDGVYGFPAEVSSLDPTEPAEPIDVGTGAFLRWDYYAEAGYPEVDTVEDLLPVLEDMQEAHPKADNGKPTYAVSLFKDWDGNSMMMGKQPGAHLYGYEEVGFVLAKADGSEYQSTLDSDSSYVRGLRFFFEANQRGLVDPESTTQNWDTIATKYEGGQVLMSWWPWLGQSKYNTDDNVAEGKGFMMVPIADQKTHASGASPYGGGLGLVYGIGSNAEDPARIAALIDWLYSPEGAATTHTGPEGLTWEIVDGEPVLTDFGRQAHLGGGADVPAEWGGGTYVDGGSAFNASNLAYNDVNPNTGLPYNYKAWPSYQETAANPLTEDWNEHVGGAATSMEYAMENDMVLVAPGSGYTKPADTTEIEAIRNQVKATIVEHSWKMVFAKNEAEFDSLLTKLQDTADGLGLQKVLEVDMANAKAQNDAREAVAADFG
jgi:multiple sugar transport system substrate-binding protein/putative aldouronate transport system substrate-binding protein